ncbi:hypothetical protein BpHYR1_019300 [Brachionus plicatilis]|uniref:Uncharacterized protein n=1 Tax=Brachionus plicatilis TaxID=10195 RepID=A0A3M7RHX3_BRAPC|nr:hypothetical protein BpHYR1_019300 [Brachionus plicatilis]
MFVCNCLKVTSFKSNLKSFISNDQGDMNFLSFQYEIGLYLRLVIYLERNTILNNIVCEFKKPPYLPNQRAKLLENKKVGLIEAILNKSLTKSLNHSINLVNYNQASN